MNPQRQNMNPVGVRRLFCLLGWLFLAACGGHSGSGPSSPLIGITASPSSVALEIGGSAVLTVTGTYANGSSTPLSAGLRFISDDPAVADVSDTGVVTALANGTAHVAVTDVTSALQAGLVTVTVAPGISRANTLSLLVDAGPPAVTLTNRIAVNKLYTTLVICSPGSATACQVVDHILVDTGSVGLVLLSAALNGNAALTAQSVGGQPLRRCLSFAAGYAWGSMESADVRLGGRTVSSLPVQLVGDAAAGNAPATCGAGAGQLQSTVAQFEANGILGIGNFLHDCGADCVTQALPGGYYVCPTSGCLPTAVPLAQQLANPIGALSSDNNGAIITMAPAVATGQQNAAGILYFGIGTQADNAPGAATFLTLDPHSGTFTTVFNGATLAGSLIDSGADALRFGDASHPACARPNQTNYCPVGGGGAPVALGLDALLQGQNGASVSQSFTVGNATALFGSGQIVAAFPTLAGPNSGAFTAFDWGLPFFYGRSVYLLFEQNAVGGVTGPAIGF